MKKLLVFLVLGALCAPCAAMAGGSVIVEVTGVSSLGDNQTVSQAKAAALADAKRKAAEAAATYVRSETTVKDYVTEKDLVEAFSQALVKLMEPIPEGERYTDPGAGWSYRVTVKAEVFPYTEGMAAKTETKKWEDDPRAPLAVSLTSKQDAYKAGQEMKLYLKGNKPFYAVVVYRDAKGELLQILPNPYRKDNYFMGGAIHELPSGPDKYELKVGPPYGKEQVIVFASTSPLGVADISAHGPVYKVQGDISGVGMATRGIQLAPSKDTPEQKAAGEFFETSLDVETTP